MLEKSLHTMLKDKHSTKVVREFMEKPHVSKEMRHLIANQGLLSMIELEGKEKGMVPAIIIAKEAGRHLLTYPYLEALLATTVLKASDQHAAVVEKIESGTVLPTIAWASEEVIGDDNGSAMILNGTLKEVPFATDADCILTVIKLYGGKNIFALLQTNAEGLSFENMQSMDETYPLYEVKLDNYSLKQSEILQIEQADELIGKIKQIGSLLLAAELTGASEKMMYETVEYMKQREQFGVLIGTFQALKHMASDMFIQVESAKAAVDYAAWAMDVDDQEAAEAVSIAKSYISQAAVKMAGDAIQMHGGIGYTWENDMHLYFKRIRRCSSLLGDCYEHREFLAKKVVDPLLANIANEENQLVNEVR